VIVGAGPGGTSLLERLVASATELLGDRSVDVHLVDPHPPGAGRVWRHRQSRLMWMNSMAEDVTMFPDDTVRCDGPIVPGPSLDEWVGVVTDDELDAEELRLEARATSGMTFPTRQLQSAYLGWVFDRVVASAPANVAIHIHETVVDRLETDAGGRQRVWLAGSIEPVVADVVVLALGHLDVAPGPEHAADAEFARANGLFHLPPDYSADLDLSGIGAGDDVIVRGIGLAVVDLGGRYRRSDDGRLEYLPSGREPRLLVGSRRGVPYHAKLGYRLEGERAALPVFLDRDAVARLSARTDGVRFFDDVWPLLAKDLGWGYYHELFTAHGERTNASWSDFSAEYRRQPLGSPELTELVTATVPAAEDRFDVDRLDRPLQDRPPSRLEPLQADLQQLIEDDLARRADPAFSADLGAFWALLVGFRQLALLAGSDALSARSRRDDVDGWWFGFFSFMASGPPPARLEQLLALSRARVVQFLGAGLWVEADEAAGCFRAGSASSTEVVEAPALIEARLPAIDVGRARSGLVSSLLRRGGISELVRIDVTDGAMIPTGRLHVDEDLHVVDARGVAQERRFALGAPTSRPAAGTFARPRTNAPAFRQNDRLARRVLSLLAGDADAAAVKVAPGAQRTRTSGRSPTISPRRRRAPVAPGQEGAP
jgi:uncharacterized NAD(P)/FAD-binding protein YdhS